VYEILLSCEPLVRAGLASTFIASYNHVILLVLTYATTHSERKQITDIERENDNQKRIRRKPQRYGQVANDSELDEMGIVKLDLRSPTCKATTQKKVKQSQAALLSISLFISVIISLYIFNKKYIMPFFLFNFDSQVNFSLSLKNEYKN
jgi:hypothetical protein